MKKNISMLMAIMLFCSIKPLANPLKGAKGKISSVIGSGKQKVGTAIAGGKQKIGSVISGGKQKVGSIIDSGKNKIGALGSKVQSGVSRVTEAPSKIANTGAKALTQPIKTISVAAAKSMRAKLNRKNKYKYCGNSGMIGKALEIDGCPGNMLPTKGQILDSVGRNKGLVRKGSDIPEAEKNIVEGITSNRKANVETAITNFSSNLDQSLRIAFCGSGGGDRAMLSTLGFMIGAKEIGLLDTTTYSAALSGSTWIQGAWITSGKDLNTIKNELRKSLALKALQVTDNLGTIPPIKKKEEIGRLINNLVTKVAFKQNIGPVDIWGGLIANHVFRGLMDPRLSLRMTDTQIPHIQTGANGKSFPFPIYTAIGGDLKKGYNWYEFTPVECGSTDVGYWCPTWAFDRKMNNGISKKWDIIPFNDKQYPPEQTLGFFMGICGSAFTINLGEVIDMILDGKDTAMKGESSNYKKVVNALLEEVKKSYVGTKSIPAAKVHNYTYGIDGSPIKNDDSILLRDAGIDFNLPLPPLLRKERKVDIIFVFDASGSILDSPGAELIKANKWAKKNGVSLPSFSSIPNLGKEAVTIIDSDKKSPVVVYMPMIKDKGLTYSGDAKDFDLSACLKKDCSTFNFKYSKKEFDGLTALTEQNMKLNLNKIKTALQEASKRANSNPWYQ